MRAILTFSALPPAAADDRLLALLSETCHCQPLFIRLYLNNSAIYQVTLPREQSFALFADDVMARGAALGIISVELDRLQHL